MASGEVGSRWYVSESQLSLSCRERQTWIRRASPGRRPLEPLHGLVYELYLTQGGNEQFEIVMLPSVGYSIGMSTPGYWEVLSSWLDQLHSRR